MKIKAVVPDNLPESLKAALNGIRPILMTRVIGPHLHRESFGPAEFYVQLCDEVDGRTHAPMCEVRLTGVSLTDDRCKTDFYKARAEIEKIYAETLAEHLPLNVELQLMVSIMLDKPLSSGGSTLVEGEQSTTIVRGTMV